MDYLKLFESLHTAFKYFVAAFIVISPFWFTTIYCFSNVDLTGNGIIIGTVSSFCLSVMYYFGQMITSAIFLGVTRKGLTEDLKNQKLTGSFFLAIMASVIYLSLPLLAYSCGYRTNFSNIIQFTFIFLVFRLYFFSLFMGKEHAKNNKPKDRHNKARP